MVSLLNWVTWTNAMRQQVDSPDSFENVSSKWMAEIHENCPGVKLVLTALKCDLRKDEEQNENPNAVTFDEGLAKAKEVGAVKYLGMSLSSSCWKMRRERKEAKL